MCVLSENIYRLRPMTRPKSQTYFDIQRNLITQPIAKYHPSTSQIIIYYSRCLSQAKFIFYTGS